MDTKYQIIICLAWVAVAVGPGCGGRGDRAGRWGAADSTAGAVSARGGAEVVGGVSATGVAGGRAVVPRDATINSTNAYSDLFLDSEKLEGFIGQQKMSDTIIGAFRNFYNARNFEFAWLSSDGLTEQALAFSSLYHYSKDSSSGRKWLDGRLDSLVTEDDLVFSSTDSWLIRTELLMTWRFINYLADRYPNEQERSANLLGLVPKQKRDPMEMAGKIIAGTEEPHPTNPWYKELVPVLAKYVDMQRAGQADTIDGQGSGEARLRGEAKGKMATAKKGRVGKRVVPALTRVKQVLVNLQRMAWMPPDPEGRLILANIPEFKLHVLEGHNKVFDMNIVVGKEGHGTVLFSGYMDRIVFNPYWNIPPSIVKKEVAPGMEKNSDYLSQHQMEVTGKAAGLPVVRQLPGPLNELGKIKFLFPNSFNIYLHDTPHKELFSQSGRAYSHGCIRVADAPKLAEYVLNDQETVDSALAVGKEVVVKVGQPVAVLICYFTAWAGEDGQAEFRKDIYGHDEKLSSRLFR